MLSVFLSICVWSDFSSLLFVLFCFVFFPVVWVMAYLQGRYHVFNSPFYSCVLGCRNEAKVDLIMIQTLLPFNCKLLCYHANEIPVSLTTRSPSASLQIKGLATKYTTVKWPIPFNNFCKYPIFTKIKKKF